MNGIIIINKEKGYTSNDVVRIVKKVLKEKVGHIGTLDPNATGVLPLLIGDATKISKYLINHNKEYEATIKLGEKRDTGDIEGRIIEERDAKIELLKAENIENVLKSFIGKQDQLPPIYSAIKINGKKLYEYARLGQKIEIQPRKIEIFDINLIDINIKEKQIKFYVKCSKGTYIRTLCENIAEKLETVGYMQDLNRISVGEFNINDSLTINELKNKVEKSNYNIFINIEDFLKFPKIDLDKKNLIQYRNGVKIDINTGIEGACKVYLEQKFIGTGIIENSKLKRDIVIKM